MNLSLQLTRSLGALALCAAVSAYAIATTVSSSIDTTSVDNAAAVAHSRLTIETVRGDDSQAHYQVAGVRVGNPVSVSKSGRRTDYVETLPRVPVALVVNVGITE